MTLAEKLNSNFVQSADDGRIFNCLVLNDYANEPGNDKHYATNAIEGKKKFETRMKTFTYEGDLVICCGGKSVTANAGKALGVVHFGKGRPMVDSDETDAMIENAPGRIVYPLTNIRKFNKTFNFSKRIVSGSFLSIFQIRLPEGINF